MNTFYLDENRLPTIDAMRYQAKSLAMLDAIISPEWDDRYFSYNSAWGAGEEMASMRNGSGDDWFMLFDSVGVALKGFAHESELASVDFLAQQLKLSVPSEFSSFLNEPSFSMDRVTFCYWQSTNDIHWHRLHHSDISLHYDGSIELLFLLVGKPSDYRAWALDYYEVELKLKNIKAIFEHTPLNEKLVLSLNPDAVFADVVLEAQEIGYPLA